MQYSTHGHRARFFNYYVISNIEVIVDSNRGILYIYQHFPTLFYWSKRHLMIAHTSDGILKNID